MGTVESADLHPYPPQSQHSRALVFVLQQGQYEPQYMAASASADTIFDMGYNRGHGVIDLPDIKKTNLVSNPVHVQRDIAVTSHDGEPYLEFKFDSTCPVVVSVSMLDGQDNDVEKMAVVTNAPIVLPTAKYPAQLGHAFCAPLGPIDKLVDAHGQVYFVITLTVENLDDNLVRGQKTYFSINRKEDLLRRKTVAKIPLHADILCQTLDITDQDTNSVAYNIQEVYGLRPDIEADCGRECIICMSEPRDTVVLPCRHMAFCRYCANVMRTRCEKCPICRQRVGTLLQFTNENT